MSNESDTANTSAAEAPAKAKGERKAKKAKPAKNLRAKKPTSKPKADRANKKAEVTAMMKRAKGATLAEIMKTTGWQTAYGAGLRQHPGQQGRGKDRVLEERRGRTDLQDREIAQATSPPNAASATRQGASAAPAILCANWRDGRLFLRADKISRGFICQAPWGQTALESRSAVWFVRLRLCRRRRGFDSLETPPLGRPACRPA